MRTVQNARELVVKARYAASPDVLFERARCFGDMMAATRPLSRYLNLPQAPMEVGQTYRTDIRALGMFRIRGYAIHVESLCAQSRKIETREAGDGIHLWLHSMEIQPDGEGALWTDRITIDAGIKTPLVARFAWLMYRHRHAKRDARAIWSHLNRSCRAVSPDLPAFRSADRRPDEIAAPLPEEKTLIAFRPGGADGAAAALRRSGTG